MSGKEMIGSVVFWRLQGNMLAQEWLPEPPRGLVALRRALEATYPDDRVEPCRSSTERALVVMRRDDHDSKVTYREVDRVWFEIGKPTKYQEEYDKACNTLEPGDVTIFLTKRIGELGGIPLRDRGGVYFLPESKVKVWRALGEGLRGVSQHQLYDIVANAGPESVRAVLDSVIQDVRQRIAETRSEDIGRRGIRNRLDAVHQWREQIKEFEGMLGASLTDLSAEVEGLGVELGQKLVLSL